MSVPFQGWIYNLADYRHIFALNGPDFQKKMLIYPSGISSVNAELHALGHSVTSIDPLYRLSFKEMSDYVQKVLKENKVYLRQNLNILSAPNEAAAESVLAAWQKSAEQFLADYEEGKKQGRYRAQDCPDAHSNGQSFELLLCSDFLFNAIAQNAPQKILNTLCASAAEVRIFPIEKSASSEIGPILLSFQQRNFGIELRSVSFPQRHNGHAMLRIWANLCEVT